MPKQSTKRRVGWRTYLCSHYHGQGAAEYSKHTHLFPLYYSNITPPVDLRIICLINLGPNYIPLNASHAAARRLFDNVWTCLRCSHAAERGSRRGR